MDQRELEVVVAEAAVEAAHRTMRRLTAVERQDKTRRAERIDKGWLDGEDLSDDDTHDPQRDQPSPRGRDSVAWLENQRRMQAIAQARKDGTLDELLKGRSPLEYLLEVPRRRTWRRPCLTTLRSASTSMSGWPD